ncbi:hypothetical protein BKA80DRAFT_105933 [Phyllosticta citrichinensis]
MEASCTATPRLAHQPSPAQPSPEINAAQCGIDVGGGVVSLTTYILLARSPCCASSAKTGRLLGRRISFWCVLLRALSRLVVPLLSPVLAFRFSLLPPSFHVSSSLSSPLLFRPSPSTVCQPHHDASEDQPCLWHYVCTAQGWLLTCLAVRSARCNARRCAAMAASMQSPRAGAGPRLCVHIHVLYMPALTASIQPGGTVWDGALTCLDSIQLDLVRLLGSLARSLVSPSRVCLARTEWSGVESTGPQRCENA